MIEPQSVSGCCDRWLAIHLFNFKIHSIMDARLELTDKQQELAEQMRNLLMKMYENHICIVSDEDGDLWLFNDEHMEDWCFAENISEDDYPMQVGDLPCVEIGTIRVLSYHEKLGIKFKV